MFLGTLRPLLPHHVAGIARAVLSSSHGCRTRCVRSAGYVAGGSGQVLFGDRMRGGSRKPAPCRSATAIEWSRLSETGWSPAERRISTGSRSRVSGSDCSHASRQALIPPANHGVDRGRQSVIRLTQKGRRRTPKCKKHLKTQIYCRRNSTWRRHYFRNKRRSRPLCVRIVRPARSQAPPSRQDVRRIFRLEFWFPDKAMIDEHSP